mmetsp:Transcript_30816/g.55134  ORF Transcript_30816/g.55134 Transcript_30816/m.55134 type:complete len:257 (-) Transcript_30816:16-786(-)
MRLRQNGAAIIVSHSGIDETGDGARIDGVEVLVGRYEAEVGRQHHGWPVFKKQGPSKMPVFLYFWNSWDWGPPGWWFGSSAGSCLAWAYAPGEGCRPPRGGWVVPIEGQPKLAGLRVRLSTDRCDTSRKEASAKAKGQMTRRALKLNRSGNHRKLAALLGLWSGTQAGKRQRHDISKDDKGNLWCSTLTEGCPDSRWTKLSVRGGTLSWGRGGVCLDLPSLKTSGLREVSWRSATKGIQWVWSRGWGDDDGQTGST